MIVRKLLGVALLLLAACRATPASPQAPEGPDPALAAIESRTGGRLGVALVDSAGRLRVSHRPDERFALCSTFKLPLAAMVLAGAADGRWRLDEGLAIEPSDVIAHSPVVERAAGEGRIAIEIAAGAIVTESDNGAANLLLRRVGGPAALTEWLRSIDDNVTRLDRFELALNENRPGDARDTTSPAAMARTAAELVHGDRLAPADRERLRGWTMSSRTGVRRVRAGLPPGWPAGDKTGSCGTAYNDVAWFEAPGGIRYALAVYLDRPTVAAPEAEAAIADVGRLVAARVR